MAAIADAVRLSRSTLEDHFRRAENQILRSLVPSLELHAVARRAEAAARSPSALPARPSGEDATGSPA